DSHMQSIVRAVATETEVSEGQYLSIVMADIASVKVVPETLDEALSGGSLEDVEVLMPFIHSTVGREQMEAMPNLRFIATRSTGYDHVDLEAAAERGIPVANVPAYGENTVAEHTFALILALSRKVHHAWVRTQRGEYTMEGLRGFDLYGKTIGVIGAGAIGLHVIRIAKGFGMKVLAFDVNRNQLLADVLDFSYADLDELLENSDIVTLHAPAIPATHHLINKDTLSQMKRTALLINTARGSLVDTAALAEALDADQIGGAGLDVFEGEELMQHEDELLQQADAEGKLKLIVRAHRLQRRPDVVITPHIGFNSEEALRRILDTTAENVRSFLEGDPSNLVG
ncbi:MAG: NAD(P)-dependent oxidoreductase, partial [Rubrobacteraceae bacterium]